MPTVDVDENLYSYFGVMVFLTYSACTWSEDRFSRPKFTSKVDFAFKRYWIPVDNVVVLSVCVMGRFV